MLEAMHDALPRSIRGLRRVEYDALVETGVLEGVPVELLDGQLVAKVSPAGSVHSGLTRRLHDILFPALPKRMTMSVNMPFAASEDSEPEPDLAIVPIGGLDAHPDQASLVIEVCHSSDYNDRVIKTRLYANAGVPEYWIVDVDARAIEIYTKPQKNRYGDMRIVGTGVISPIAMPNAQVDLAQLFA